jgi:predicted DNA-binding transcriptional regulator AlpA
MKPRTQPVTSIVSEIQPSRILTVQDVSELLQIPKSSVYERTRRRLGNTPPLPSRKVGKYLRFFEHEVLGWLTALPQSRRAA